VDVKSQMDRIYGEIPLAEIPWNIEQPPRGLVELVESGRITPCETLDLGCGAGNDTVWLAERGFRVTGIDLSAAAIAHAEALACRRGVSCRFVVADLVAAPPPFDAAFDFAFEWEVLHHVLPADRPRYVAGVHQMLSGGATYLSVCFAENDPGLPDGGKLRTTPLGTLLYLSSEQELSALFEPLFDIEELSTISVEGRRTEHLAVRTLMRKSGQLRC